MAFGLRRPKIPAPSAAVGLAEAELGATFPGVLFATSRPAARSYHAMAGG